MDKTQEADLMRRWRSQIARHGHRRRKQPPRPVAAVGYLTSTPYPVEFVEVSHLTLVVVRDHVRRSGTNTTGLFGYRASLVPHGVQWGGAGNVCLQKDLGLSPIPSGRGRRLDCRNTQLLELALRLERRLEQACRYRQPTRGRLQLPRLWAGFRSGVAGSIRGEGPELEKLCRRFGMAQEAMFRKFERRFDGLHLYPLDWASEQLPAAVTVFAELPEFPRQQAVRLHGLPGVLVGFSGAVAYDFYSPGPCSARTVTAPSSFVRRPALSQCLTAGSRLPCA